MSTRDKGFYFGFSANLKKRIHDHSKGKNKSTKNRRPLKLVYYEAHISKFDALRREKYFKTTKGRATVRLMLRDYLSGKYL